MSGSLMSSAPAPLVATSSDARNDTATFLKLHVIKAVACVQIS